MTVADYKRKIEESSPNKESVANAFAFACEGLEIWTNDACMGYMISAMKRKGMSDEVIQKAMEGVKNAFDELTLEEAAEVYRKSPF